MPQRHQRGTGCATGREEGSRAWTSWATDAGRTTLAELRGLLRSVRPGLSESAFSRSADVDRGKWPLPDRAAAPGDATPPSRPRAGTEGVEGWNPNRNAAINTPPRTWRSCTACSATCCCSTTCGGKGRACCTCPAFGDAGGAGGVRDVAAVGRCLASRGLRSSAARCGVLLPLTARPPPPVVAFGGSTYPVVRQPARRRGSVPQVWLGRGARRGGGHARGWCLAQ